MDEFRVRDVVQNLSSVLRWLRGRDELSAIAAFFVGSEIAEARAKAWAIDSEELRERAVLLVKAVSTVAMSHILRTDEWR